MLQKWLESRPALLARWQRYKTPHFVMRLNAVLLLIAVCANFYFQAFCLPSLWAAGLFLLAAVHTIFLPYTRHWSPLMQPILGFLGGVSACVWLYFVVFLGWDVLFVVIFFVQPLVLLGLLAPFLLCQLLWQQLFRPTHWLSLLGFAAGIALSVSVCIWASNRYEVQAQAIRSAQKSGDFSRVERDFMSEKIMGIGFLYHLEFCIFDGWRPPLHEPLLVLGYWFSAEEFPQRRVPLAERLRHYRAVFPENKLPFPCSCAYSYSSDYFRDSLWVE